MKWFRHNTDSHINLKLREIFADFGLEGYALYWLCLELVGQQGVKYRLNGSKSWQKALKEISKLPQEKMDKILTRFAELNLICAKSLKNKDLYIPKMREYSDDYTNKVRRMSEQGTELVHLQYNTLHNITEQYITTKGWDRNNKELVNEIYKQNVKPAKKILLLTKDLDNALMCLAWVAELMNKQGLNWNMWTVLKWLPEWQKTRPSPEALEYQKKFGG